MSLSPVIGTEVPETANGVVTPVSENCPHDPVSVNCRGSRLTCPEDESLRHTENHVDGENRVYNDEGYLDTQTDINEITSALSIHGPLGTNPCLSDACSGDGESESTIRNIPEATKSVASAGAVLLGDSAHTKDSSHQRGSVTTDRDVIDPVTADRGTNNGEEVGVGEKEKQDDEGDEKNENKWKSQYAGGRTEYTVSSLQDFYLFIS